MRRLDSESVKSGQLKDTLNSKLSIYLASKNEKLKI